jgi:hypothetical protein
MPSSHAWYELTHLPRTSLQALEYDSGSISRYIVPLHGVNDKQYVVLPKKAGEDSPYMLS